MKENHLVDTFGMKIALSKPTPSHFSFYIVPDVIKRQQEGFDKEIFNQTSFMNNSPNTNHQM